MKVNPIIAALAIGGFITLSTAHAQATQATNSLNTNEKKQMETVVHDYLLQNPDVLVQSLQSYQQKQMEQTQKTFQKIQEVAPKFANQLFHQASDPIAGNPKGTITLVEFSDYQCPHCIDMTKIVDNLIKKHTNLRVIVKEFPIRGTESNFAAKAALAAQKQNKYYEFHNALMFSKTQPLTQDSIFDIAKSVGLNVDKLKKDMQDSSVEQQIKNTYQLAQGLQLMFTPVFFIAKSTISENDGPNAVIFIPGGVSEDQLSDAIGKMS